MTHDYSILIMKVTAGQQGEGRSSNSELWKFKTERGVWRAICRHELITPEIRPKSASTSKYVENVFFIKKPFSFFIFEKRLEE
jgi:hypothetical protein